MHVFLKSTFSIGILFLLLLGSAKVQAQTPASFPKDSIAYFNAMEAFLTEARKEGKGFMKQFESVWYGGYFTEKQREGVYTVTNLMLKKKLRAFPDFRNYLFTVGSFVVDENQTEESFIAWQGIILKLLDDKRKKGFTDFLEFCNGLFRQNAIYTSASTEWAANNSNYLFAYDSLPKITFESLDLICFAKRDSMKIKNTKGSYYPTEGIWYGEKGLVTWKRAGLLEDEVYAELNNYKLETKTYSYEADSVIFYNSFYLNEPLIGKLTDKLLANVTPERATYPQFDSYDKRIRIENISPGVNFEGGFSMVGPKLLGKGDEDNDAQIEFFKDDTLFIKAASESFSIRVDKIVSTQAAVSIYLGKDSITHPGLNFKYLVDQKLITLYKENQGVAISPYTNSFHDLEMNFEVMNWKTDEPVLEFTNLLGGTKTDALFISSDFFKEEMFDKIRGMADVNPLFKIYEMVKEFDTTVLHVSDVSHKLGVDYVSGQNMIVYLSTLGFVSFDFDKEKVFVKQKLIDFVLAKTKKIDYDVISIYSNIEDKANAIVNLHNYDLSINGITQIVVSDSQQVVILPRGGQIKMKRNRYFEFAGQIKAGRFDFHGKEFSFDYEQFKINLVNVDSLQIKALSGEKDKSGNPILKPVRTVIENVNGDLLIDNPGNKSGLKDFPDYPILNSKDKSFVYYDKKEVLNGVYKRNNFYFELNPFTIDSLDNFTNSKLKFDGTFSSANIFPEFKDQLKLQPDFSLGFIRNTPVNGFPMYRGKGQFFDEINLSHKGLRGNGKLEYITSTTYSKDFIFYPDSMLTLADRYVVERQSGDIQFPPVTANATKMRWLPYEDVMYATTTTEGMVMHSKDDKFEGTTSLTPQQVRGVGTYHFVRADLVSNQFVFKADDINADTADFYLKDETPGAFALKTKNQNAHVDYKGRFVEFKANGKYDPIEFPINQYICYMEEFKWYMDNGLIDLKGSSSKNVAADVKMEGSKFISTHPDQDSLLFYAPLARYDSRRHIIKAKDVIYINAADARIYPDSGTDVTIKKKAEMEPLVNSTIIASSVTEYHKVYEANTKIFGRKSYTSSGFVDYVDENENVQPIYLSNIIVDTTGQTIGTGVIEDSVDFSLSEHFAFDGGVKLFGGKQFLVFDGASRLSHECDLLTTPWFKFEAEINPLDIYIPIDTNMRDTGDAVLLTGVNLNVDSVFLYSAFLNQRSNYSDIGLIPTYGFLHYDKEKKEYVISSKEKIAEPSLTGNYLKLNTNDCKIYADGKIDIGARTGNLKFEAAGNIVHNQIDNSVVLDLMMTVDFFFDDNSMKKMAEDLNENINLQATDFNRLTYERGLKEIVGTEKADEIISQLSLNGKVKRLPDELNKRLVFNDVKFKWVEELNAYKSFGKIGLSNINKEEVNKYLDGKIMITKKRTGDLIDIYLEADNTTWYYFSYRKGLMKVISSNETFNTQIKEIKKDKRRYQNAKGEEPFTFMFGVEKEKRDFEREFDSEL